jgi:hypothetical protein
MVTFQLMAATRPYWQPAEQAVRERRAQRAALAVAAQRSGEPTTPEPPRRRALIPRIAGALGLF